MRTLLELCLHLSSLGVRAKRSHLVPCLSSRAPEFLDNWAIFGAVLLVTPPNVFILHLPNRSGSMANIPRGPTNIHHFCNNLTGRKSTFACEANATLPEVCLHLTVLSSSALLLSRDARHHDHHQQEDHQPLHCALFLLGLHSITPPPILISLRLETRQSIQSCFTDKYEAVTDLSLLRTAVSHL